MNKLKKQSFYKFLEEIGEGKTAGQRYAGLKADNNDLVPIITVIKEKNENNRTEIYITQEEIKKYISFLIYKFFNKKKNEKSIREDFLNTYTSKESFLKTLVNYKLNIEKIINNTKALYDEDDYEHIKEKSNYILKLFTFIDYTKEEDVIAKEIIEAFEIIKQNNQNKIYIEKIKKNFNKRLEEIKLQLNNVSDILEKEIDFSDISKTNEYLNSLKYDCKLLKPYKNYFFSVKKGISKNKFIEETNNIFKIQLDKIKKTFESIDILELCYNISDLNISIKSKQEYKQSILIMENLENVFQFYNSAEGKKINEYFKSFNILNETIKFINIFIKYKNIVDDENYKILQFRGLGFLNSRIQILGYDYYLEDHILFDLYETLLNLENMKKYDLTKNKIYDYIKIFLAHTNSFIGSDYRGKIIESAIKTNEPRFVEILKPSLEGIDKKSLHILFQNKNIEEMFYPVIDCFKDINLKNLYLKIYEGDVEFVEFLYEKKKVDIFKERFPIEMEICVKGKNSLEIFQIFLRFLKRELRESHYQLIFESLLEIAIWELKNSDKTKELIKSQMEYIQNLSYVENLYKHLIILLNLNKLDVFEEIYYSNKFDSIKLFREFIKTSSDFLIKPTKETWNKMISNYFKDINLNLLEKDIKEDFLFSKNSEILLKKLLKESKKYTNTFEKVDKYLQDNPDGKIYCYRGN